MPDSFFVNDRKRKRQGGGAGGAGSSKRPATGGGSSSSRGRGGARGGSAGRGRGGASRGGRGGGRGDGLDSERQRSAQRARSRPGDDDDDEELASGSDDDDARSAASSAGSLDGRRGRRGDAGPTDERDEDAAFAASETAAERRLRLARAHLGRVRDEVELERETRERAGFFDAEEVDRENIAARLHAEEDSASGRIHAFIGSNLHTKPATRFVSSFAGDHATTCSAVAPGKLYVANKRGTVVAYSLPSLELCGRPFGQGEGLQQGAKSKGKKQAANAVTKGLRNKNPASAAEAAAASGHRGEILCLAASEDGRYVVTGGRDKMLGIWEVQQGGSSGVRWLRALPGHKDAVTSISIPALSNTSHHVLSASLSRHLCLHSLATLSLVDTLFGHQDSITSVSSLKPSIAVTSGARDRTCRWWKVEEEVQLVFRGGGRSVLRNENNTSSGDKEQLQPEVPKPSKLKTQKPVAEFFEGSVDTVCMLDESHFLSGGDTGSICLWHTGKKKPIFTVQLAHGLETRGPAGSPSQPRWITAIGALRGTDVFASGSWDGSIRLWSIAATLKSFSPLFEIPARGFVNSLQITSLPVGDVADLFDASRGTQRGKQAHVLVAGMAQEQRLGRWHRVHEAKNGTLLANLTFA